MGFRKENYLLNLRTKRLWHSLASLETMIRQEGNECVELVPSLYLDAEI